MILDFECNLFPKESRRLARVGSCSGGCLENLCQVLFNRDTSAGYFLTEIPVPGTFLTRILLPGTFETGIPVPGTFLTRIPVLDTF